MPKTYNNKEVEFLTYMVYTGFISSINLVKNMENMVPNFRQIA